jgi:ribonucleoside-diphosphate reductase alpha chain/ribonucleoside-triphosphate reductase
MKEVNYTRLGEVIDCRTYRRLKSDGTRETGYESLERVTRYNIDLAKDYINKEHLDREYNLLLDKLSNLQVSTSNRARWAAGSKTIDYNPICAYNCSCLAIDSLDKFSNLMFNLMLGAGVGFRVFDRDISQLPFIKNKDLSISFKEYQPISKVNRKEHTYWDGDELVVGDSKEGWTTCTLYVLEELHSGIRKSISINIDNVRPWGEPLKTFGGTASGPEALIKTIKDIDLIIKECPNKQLRSIDCMDISCCIAVQIAVGGTRRAALICLFEEGDILCAKAKEDIGSFITNKSYRFQSNNTECIGSKGWNELVLYLYNKPNATYLEVKPLIDKYKPSYSELEKRLDTLKKAGEPGFNNYLLMCWKRYESARKVRPAKDCLKYLDCGTNPCHEIILSIGHKSNEDIINTTKGILTPSKGGGLCNLSSINIPNHIYNGTLNLRELEQSTRIITRASVRQTLVSIPWEDWDSIQQDERLLGVSLTGWQDAMYLLDIDTLSEEAKDIRKKIYEWVREEANIYADILKIDRPIATTCIKPEGTTSLIFGSSAGLHWSWSPYYYRRVQMGAKNALSLTLKDMGYPVVPYPYSHTCKLINEYLDKETNDIKEILDSYNQLDKGLKDEILSKVDSWLFTFPIKAPTNISSFDVSAIKQLDNLLAFTKEYVEHLPSCTITVKDDTEWLRVLNWLESNWSNGFTNASFLSYYVSTPTLPFEECSKEDYESLLSKIPSYCKEVKGSNESESILFLVDYDILNKHELILNGVSNDDVVDDTCKSGCPIR